MLGPINRAGQGFISELGLRISASTEDPREACSVFQRISVALRRFNAVCFANSFASHGVFANHPKHAVMFVSCFL
jgi:hypothetical protein